MGIAAAHQAAAQLHQQIRMGESPVGLYDRLRVERETLTLAESQQQQETEDARKHSFTVLSDAWLEDRKPSWAPTTYIKSTFIVQKRLQPSLGNADMRTLASKDVVPVLVELANATPSIAVKARQCLNGIVDYARIAGCRILR